MPECLKIAIHRPIYKSGSKLDFDNYRQIANFPVIEKIIEKYIAKKLYNYLNTFSILHSTKFAFQKGRGTNVLLKDFGNVIRNKLNDQQHVIVTFVDYSKAFDMIDHTIMFEILKKIGIQGRILNWLKSFLTNRKYAVRYRDKISSQRTITTGVPQGSVLGPLLYIQRVLRKFCNTALFI